MALVRKWTPEEIDTLLSWEGSWEALSILLGRTKGSLTSYKFYILNRESVKRANAERARIYRNSSEYRNRQRVARKKYTSRPEVREKIRAYNAGYAIATREAKSAYNRDYRRRDGVCERGNERKRNSRHKKQVQRYEHEMMQFFMKGPQNVNISSK